MITKDTLMISLDIETTGTVPGCGILSIGAEAFTLEDKDPRSFFSITIDQVGRPSKLVDDSETMLWWSKQDVYARANSFSGTYCYEVALKTFSNWVSIISEPYRKKRFWVKGLNFDIPILEYCYSCVEYKSKIPWKYHELMDLRTLIEVHSNIILPKRSSIEHTAINDAMHQAECLRCILNAIRPLFLNEFPESSADPEWGRLVGY